jgi:hypothetical protein
MAPMRARLAVIAVAVAGLAVAIPAQAGTSLPSLPSLFAHQIHAINAAPHAPAILLPRSMPLDAKHLNPAGSASGSSYDLSIGAVAKCFSADACFVADFSAGKFKTVFGKHVKVRGASKAGFLPLSCGASCSPPQIDFLVHGILYTIQANMKTSHGDRAALIAAAQAAISAGPR